MNGMTIRKLEDGDYLVHFEIAAEKAPLLRAERPIGKRGDSRAQASAERPPRRA